MYLPIYECGDLVDTVLGEGIVKSVPGNVKPFETRYLVRIGENDKWIPEFEIRVAVRTCPACDQEVPPMELEKDYVCRRCRFG